MDWKKIGLVAVFSLAICLTCSTAAEAELRAAPEDGGAAVAHASHGLPAKAVEIGRIGTFPLTNSMLVTWICAALLIIFAQTSMRDVKAIPEGAQNFWEWLVESLHTFLEGIIGHDLVRKTFWFFATVFIFILFSNWLGLIPGVGTIGWGHRDDTGHFQIAEPWFRGANAFRLLVLLGAANERSGWISVAPIRTQRWDDWVAKSSDDRGLFGSGGSGSGLDTVPAGLSKLPVVWKYFCG
jgi:hypothetical protein